LGSLPEPPCRVGQRYFRGSVWEACRRQIRPCRDGFDSRGNIPLNHRLCFQMNVVLYTRAGCHLCDDARELLENHGLRPQPVDIDADPALRERFHECVPVVEIDGKVRFRGRVDPILLRRLLRG
jgi:glutaredoxin